jgi:hypothetical protein
MATPPVVPVDLANPPAQPPDVTSQQAGGGGGAALAELAQRQVQQAAAGAPPGPLPSPADPHGALRAGFELVRRILEEMSRLSPEFAPFAQRMIAIGSAGLGEAVTRAGKATPSGTEPETPAPRGGRRGRGETAGAPATREPFPG